MADKMDDAELAYILEQESQSAVGYYNSEVANDQEKAQNYYNGEPFGNEEEGRSQVISRDVATVVDGVMPDLIKLFLAGDDVVEFEPTSPRDEEFARQATDYCNYIFFKDNDGYTVLHDWAKDGLINKYGIVKVYWHEEDVVDKKIFQGVPEEIVVAIDQEGADITEATPSEDGLTLDIKIEEKETRGRVVVEAVPPEEFFVAPRQKTLQDAVYTSHKSLKTIDELVAMGFDRDTIEGLQGSAGDDDPEFDLRRVDRYKDQDYTFEETDAIDPGMRKVWVNEEYIRIDFDGDGIAELRKVTRIDTEILENIEVDFHPFVDFTPIKLSHTFVGKSMADDTMDIQLVKSTLLRQSLDNLYQTNNPRVEVPENVIGENTFDDLLTVRPGAPIRTRGAGGLLPMSVPFTAQNSFGMLDYWDNEREQRTGVTRYNQGLDADTLNDTATGIELIQNKGMGKIELIARNLGNSMGILFQKMVKLVIEYQKDMRQVRMGGEWRDVNTQGWSPEMGVNITVGLGTGDKGERIKARMAILQMQKEMIASGMATQEEVYNNIDGLVRDMDLGMASQYFVHPSKIQPKPPQPDPMVMIEAKKLEAKNKEAQANVMLKKQSQEAENALKAQDNQLDAQAKERQLEIQLILGREKLEMEAQLKREQMAAEWQLKREEMAIEARLNAMGADDSIDNVEMGGDLG